MRVNRCDLWKSSGIAEMPSKQCLKLRLVCISVWGLISAVTSQTPVPKSEFSSEDEIIILSPTSGSCPLSGKFLYKDTRCWVTRMLESLQAAGEDSFCHVISGPERGLFKCQQGRWIPAEQTKRKTLKRVRKGFWRSPSPPPPPPPPPNQPPYFTACPDNLNVNAPSNQRGAVVTWSVQAADSGGSVTVTLKQGSESGSYFSEGTTVIEYTATDTGNLKASCVFTVTVTVLRCPDVQELSHFANGSQSCSGLEKNIYGSVCQHSCDVGHVLQGQQAVTCQQSASWSSSFPSCQPVSCGAPGTVAGGQVVCPQGHVYPHTCTVHCLTGYQNFGTVTSVTCESSGHWSSQRPLCTDIEAPTFPNGCPSDQHLYSGPLEAPVAVTWADPVTMDNSNLEVTLTSDPAKGTQLGVGLHTVTLTATDEAGNNRSCQFQVTVETRFCEALNPPANGEISCTRNNVEGSECTAVCHLGYRLKGTATLLCLNTRQWDHSSPVCEAIVCQPPSVPNGNFECPSGYQHPASCSLTCLQGFQVQAPEETHCLEDATWSPFGFCLDVQPPQFPSGCPEDIEVYASPVGSDTVVTWSAPGVTDNSPAAVDLQSDVTPGASFRPGTTRVTYEASDDSGNVATCQFSVTVNVLRCQDPGIEFSDDDMAAIVYTCDDGYDYGAVCTLSCTQGYALVGESTVECDKDERTHPPTTLWLWAGGGSGKPVCREDRCPPPPAPANGALSCHLGALGKDCVVSCHTAWDLPPDISPHLYCINEVGTWWPNARAMERGCVERRLPHRQITRTSIFYYVQSCDSSEEELRQKFVTRMRASIFRDACTHVPTCLAENVKVTCGSLWPPSARRRRMADRQKSPEERTLLHRILRRGVSRRRRSTHYILVTFEVHMPYVEDGLSPEETYLRYMTSQKLLRQKLSTEVRGGNLDVGGVKVEERGVGPSTMRLDCPSGTLLRPDHQSLGRFSCVGCSRGYYLPPNSTQCLECPRGQNSEEDNATSCTP